MPPKILAIARLDSNQVTLHLYDDEKVLTRPRYVRNMKTGRRSLVLRSFCLSLYSRSVLHRMLRYLAGCICEALVT